MAQQLEQRRAGWASGALGRRSLLLVFWAIGGIFLFLVLSPIVQLFANQTPAGLSSVAAIPSVQSAIFLSLATAAITAVVAAILGTPLAYALVHSTFRGHGIIDALVDLPLAVPHTVAGIALLLVYGRTGFIGGPAESLFGLQFYNAAIGIVVALLFVSSPFMINSAKLGFASVDPRLEKVARTLGASPWRVFREVSLPLSIRSVLTGMLLTYARAISEIGAVIVLAYYPMTAPVKIYTLFLETGLPESSAMAVLLLAITLSTFMVFRYLAYGRPASGGKQ
ncbi:MAG: ABC transporter permease [Chloroflexi bacterium]|nr:ABC transporter permease [Chloroflexota bacterium]